jgi:aminoglycoside phosphotransferase (APT) family kinase protein
MSGVSWPRCTPSTPEQARALGVRQPDWQESYRGQCAEFERRVLPLLPWGDRPGGQRLLAHAAVLDGFTATLVHADLGPGHLLCRGDRLVGVIDWGDVCVGDPALDLSWPLHELRALAVDALLVAYGGAPDPGFGERARVYHALAPWYEADYGVFTDQPTFVASGLAGIHRRLSAWTPAA